MDSCSLEWADFVCGVGLDGFHISGVASDWPRCGAGFCGDERCSPYLRLSVDTVFGGIVQGS